MDTQSRMIAPLNTSASILVEESVVVDSTTRTVSNQPILLILLCWTVRVPTSALEPYRTYTLFTSIMDRRSPAKAKSMCGWVVGVNHVSSIVASVYLPYSSYEVHLASGPASVFSWHPGLPIESVCVRRFCFRLLSPCFERNLSQRSLEV